MTAALAGLVLALVAGQAPAEGLRWQAAAGCPDALAVTGAIERRLGRALAVGEARVDATVVAEGRAYRLVLRLEVGARGEAREVVDESCAALAQVVALRVAAAVEGPMVPEPPAGGGVVEGEIVGGEIVGGEIVGGEIVGGEIVSGEIAGGEIVGGEIAKGEIARGEIARGEIVGAGEAFEAGFGAIGEAGCGGEAFDGALQGVEGGLGGGDLTDKEEFEFACGGVFSGELRGALGDGVAGCGGGKRHEEIPCAVSVEACKGRARVGKA